MVGLQAHVESDRIKHVRGCVKVLYLIIALQNVKKSSTYIKDY